MDTRVSVPDAAGLRVMNLDLQRDSSAYAVIESGGI